MGPWGKSWPSQADAVWWRWQSPRRTLLGGKEKGIWGSMHCWWEHKAPEKAAENDCDSSLFHLCAFLSRTVHFLMWLKWTLVLPSKESKEMLAWYVFADENRVIHRNDDDELEFLSWVGWYSHGCHGFRRNKQMIALKASTNFQHDVDPLSLCIIVFSTWFGADSLPFRSLHCKSDSYFLRPNLRILWPGSSLALPVSVWLIYQTRCGWTSCIWGN